MAGGLPQRLAAQECQADRCGFRGGDLLQHRVKCLPIGSSRGAVGRLWLLVQPAAAMGMGRIKALVAQRYVTAFMHGSRDPYKPRTIAQVVMQSAANAAVEVRSSRPIGIATFSSPDQCLTCDLNQIVLLEEWGVATCPAQGNGIGLRKVGQNERVTIRSRLTLSQG